MAIQNGSSFKKGQYFMAFLKWIFEEMGKFELQPWKWGSVKKERTEREHIKERERERERETGKTERERQREGERQRDRERVL